MNIMRQNSTPSAWSGGEGETTPPNSPATWIKAPCAAAFAAPLTGNPGTYGYAGLAEMRFGWSS